LATDRNVAAATQNQAMNALAFLYKQVLEKPLEKRIDAAGRGSNRILSAQAVIPAGSAGNQKPWMAMLNTQIFFSS
jgi:hypothetical protein